MKKQTKTTKPAISSNGVLPAVFTIEDAKEVVAAWEALKGGRNYSGREIEQWLADYMKPAIDKLRSKINGR